MTRFIILCTFLFAACSNSGSGENKGSDTSSHSGTYNTADWPKDKENELLDGCIEELKGQMSQDSAYTYCNCVLKQLRKDFPNIDSASSALQDSTEAARYVANCR